MTAPRKELAVNRLLPPLYALDAKGNVLVWKTHTEGPDVVTLHGRLDGAHQTARFACKPKNVGRANATTAEEQAVAEATAKWEKQRKKKYYLTIDEAKNTASRKPMLAQKFDQHKKKLVYPVIVQPKLDGVRCLAYREGGKVVLHSRGGEVYDVKHISDALEPYLGEDEELDGEIYIHGMSLQQIVSLVKRPQGGSLSLQYWVYDMPQEGRTNEERDHDRYEWFRKVYATAGESCVVRQVVSSLQHKESYVRAFHDNCVLAGYEGAIIRSRTGLYRHGYRSPDLLKMKVFDDGEFTITGWKTGKGAFAGVPVFECQARGGTFDVVPRGCAEVRTELLAQAPNLVGKQLTVRHFGWTDEGLPRFPVGICVREPGT